MDTWELKGFLNEAEWMENNKESVTTYNETASYKTSINSEFGKKYITQTQL